MNAYVFGLTKSGRRNHKKRKLHSLHNINKKPALKRAYIFKKSKKTILYLPPYPPGNSSYHSLHLAHKLTSRRSQTL